MRRKNIRQMFEKVGAIITGDHFVYTSGQHGSAYVNKNALYPHTHEISRLCKIIAEYFADNDVDIVVAPATGGVILSQWVAYHLSEIIGYEVLSIHAEKAKTPGSPLWHISCGLNLIWKRIPIAGHESKEYFVIKRGYENLISKKRILFVDDVLTTGGSIKKLIKVVKSLNGEVIGLGVLCNRSGVALKDLVNLHRTFSLLNVNLKTWDPDDCPLCAQDVPINKSFGKI